MANKGRTNPEEHETQTSKADQNLVEQLFGSKAEVAGQGGFFEKAARVGGRVSVTTKNVTDLKEYATALADGLIKGKASGATGIGEIGMFEKIRDFFENTYPNFYPDSKFYVKETDKIEIYIPLLLSFKADLTGVSLRNEVKEKEKEFDPKALNSQDLAILLEEYRQYLEEGKDKKEIEDLLARFMIDVEPNQAKKMVKFWLELQQKKVLETGQTNSQTNDELLLEVEAAKKIGVSEPIAAKIITYAQKQAAGGLISEQDLASSVSVVTRQEQVAVGQIEPQVLVGLREQINEYIGKKRINEISLQTAKGIIDSKEIKQQQQIGKIIEELVVLPLSTEELIAKVSRVVGPEVAPMVAKKVVVAVEKIVIENPTLVLIRESGALKDQINHELIFMKKSPEFLTKNLKTQKEIWEAAKSVQKTTGDIYKNPAARILELSRISLDLADNRENRRALLGIEALVGLAGMKQVEVEKTATDFNKHMRVLSRYGIRKFGDRVEALDNAVRVVSGEKGRLMLDQIRQRLDKIGMLTKLEKVEQIGNLSVSGLSKKVFEALGGQELVKKVITQLGADGLVKGTGIALGKLSGGVVTKAASWIATRLGVNVAIPGVGTAISVVLIAKDLLGLAAGKIKGVLADLGIQVGIKKFVEENFGKVPGFFAGIAEDVIVVLGSAIAGISLSFLLPVFVTIFVGLFAYQMFVAMNVSSLVPPKPATSFVLFDAKKYPGGVIPSSCPSGWPIEHGYMTQGPMTTSSHRGAQALDLANIGGTPIYATHDGIVKVAGYSAIFGNYVVLSGECENPDTKQKVEFSTLYGHMIYSPVVNVYDQITRGTLLGLEGSTGKSSGPHVHYQLNSMGSILSFIPVFSSLFSQIFGCIGVAACGVSF